MGQSSIIISSTVTVIVKLHVTYDIMLYDMTCDAMYDATYDVMYDATYEDNTSLAARTMAAICDRSPHSARKLSVAAWIKRGETQTSSLKRLSVVRTMPVSGSCTTDERACSCYIRIYRKNGKLGEFPGNSPGNNRRIGKEHLLYLVPIYKYAITIDYCRAGFDGNGLTAVKIAMK